VIQFLPQHLLAIRSTLREQLLLTNPERTFDDDQFRDALRKVGLESVLDRLGGLDVEHDWAAALSFGEQHLITMARLLLTRPRFAFLNQITEALGPDQVEQLYRVLADASITCLSIGENQHLLAYHNTVLELLDDGRWRLTTAENAANV
jgi:putative ATP-binding cassette transporter